MLKHVPGLIVTLLMWTTTAHALDLTGCDPIPDGTVGILQNDVACIGENLQIGSNATLDLNGFTLTGIADCASGMCTVVSSSGPGSIVGMVLVTKGRIDNVSIDCGGETIGIWLADKLTITNASIANCSDYGIDRWFGPVDVRAENLTVTNCGVGMELNSGKLKGTNVTISNNADVGVYAGKIVLAGATAVGNGRWGVSAANKVKIRGGSITGNGEAGIWVVYGNASLRAADVTGNGIDIAAARRPRLVDSTCVTSRIVVDRVTMTPDSWGVCPGE